jgi:hypothetical protein
MGYLARMEAASQRIFVMLALTFDLIWLRTAEAPSSNPSVRRADVARSKGEAAWL